MVFGEGVDDEKYVILKVSWVQHASVKVVKKDDTADANLSGAVFGLYSDADLYKADHKDCLQQIRMENLLYDH